MTEEAFIRKINYTYYGIRQRCNGKNTKSYKNYGGRGIKCLITRDELVALWKRDKAASMKRPSLGRIDHNSHYSFKNCRFEEHSHNSAFRRNSYKKVCRHGHKITKKNLCIMTTQEGYMDRRCLHCQRIANKKHRAKLRLKKQALGFSEASGGR